MPYSKTPSVSTYETKRKDFILDLQSRYTQDNRNDDRDAKIVNMLIDPLVTSSQENAKTFAKPRPGLTLQLTPPAGIPYGMHWWGSFLCLVYIINRNVYTDTYGLIGTLAPGGGPYEFTEHTSSSGTKYLIISDGRSAYYMVDASSGVTGIGAANFIAIGTHSAKMVSLDGYLFVAQAGSNRIYNSALTDPYTWPGDYISAEMYSDNLAGICTNNNYLYAIGEQSVEYFYDAGNATGTPLARYSAAVQQFGCVADATIVQTEAQVLFVGETGNGGWTVWQLDGFKATDISTPVIKQALVNVNYSGYRSLNNTSAYCIRVGGQKLYVLNLFEVSLVYNFETKLWSTWTSTKNSTGVTSVFIGRRATDNYTGYPYIQDDDGLIYSMTEHAYTDGPNYSFVCSVTTPKYDFDSINRKFMSRFTLLGDYTGTPNYSTGAITNANNQFYISWNDNDYASADWTVPRLLTFTNDYPSITQLGSFRRRAFKISCTPIDIFRLEGLEVDINKGSQ